MGYKEQLRSVSPLRTLRRLSDAGSDVEDPDPSPRSSFREKASEALYVFRHPEEVSEGVVNTAKGAETFFKGGFKSAAEYKQKRLDALIKETATKNVDPFAEMVARLEVKTYRTDTGSQYSTQAIETAIPKVQKILRKIREFTDLAVNSLVTDTRKPDVDVDTTIALNGYKPTFEYESTDEVTGHRSYGLSHNIGTDTTLKYVSEIPIEQIGQILSQAS